MPDPLHSKVCLVGKGCLCPTVTLFLAPEPLIPGGSILHVLEQAAFTDNTGPPNPDPELIELVQSEPTGEHHRLHAEVRAFLTGHPDQHRINDILHDHHITDTTPIGLDLGDPAEMWRLALLPEQPIGFRRTEDFQEEATRRAMLAVYRYFEVDQRIRLMYHGFADPNSGWFALRTAIA